MSAGSPGDLIGVAASAGPLIKKDLECGVRSKQNWALIDGAQYLHGKTEDMYSTPLTCLYYMELKNEKKWKHVNQMWICCYSRSYVFKSCFVCFLLILFVLGFFASFPLLFLIKNIMRTTFILEPNLCIISPRIMTVIKKKCLLQCLWQEKKVCFHNGSTPVYYHCYYPLSLLTSFFFIFAMSVVASVQLFQYGALGHCKVFFQIVIL